MWVFLYIQLVCKLVPFSLAFNWGIHGIVVGIFEYAIVKNFRWHILTWPSRLSSLYIKFHPYHCALHLTDFFLNFWDSVLIVFWFEQCFCVVSCINFVVLFFRVNSLMWAFYILNMFACSFNFIFPNNHLQSTFR